MSRARRLACFVMPFLAFVAFAPAEAAKLYPTDRCVSDKLRAAAKVCSVVLRSHADFEKHRDVSRRDAALGKARTKLAKAWGRAEKRVARQVDCAETSATSAEIAARIEEGAAELAAAVNDGLDLALEVDARCGRDLLRSAQSACQGLLRAESLHLRQRTRDRLRLRLSADEAVALADFEERAGQVRNGCATTATTTALADILGETVDEVVDLATVSPAVDDQAFDMITPEPVKYLGQTLSPICFHGTPYVFFAKRGSVNKLVVYFQGGGACWNQLTSAVGACKQSTGAFDDPDGASSGFADLSNPENPFRDWHQVMIPYCTGDVHWGDATFTHEFAGESIVAEHKGAVNARVVEKWAREHFVNPERVFVTGSSAGAYGAIASSPYLMEFSYPSSRFDVVGDAGNGVITQDFLVNDISKWGIEKNVPRFIEALDVPLTDLSLEDVYVEVARQYPWNRFATYTTAFDGGGGGQTGFYNIMLNGGDPLASFTWWDASCAWNEAMRQQNFETFARVPANFRYYVGTGSRHTMWGANKVYTDTTGGVPTIVDWLNAMLEDSPDWMNVECQDCGVTLPGDPKPSVLPTPPFDEDGNIVCEPEPEPE